MATVDTLTFDISNILQDIYDSEINLTISWFWDEGINIVIGDNTNGIRKARNFDTIRQALSYLAVAVSEMYPDSDFARKWTNG